jgi:L-threonylcarbamoyladenylate synthase
VPEIAWDLLQATDHDEDAPQRPLTIIYPGAKNLAENLVAEDGSIGIRITSEPFSQALCQRLKRPIVSTSANISGQPAARFYDEINEAILTGADYVCRFRRDDQTPHEPSSIIKLGQDGTFQIIRP